MDSLLLQEGLSPRLERRIALCLPKIAANISPTGMEKLRATSYRDLVSLDCWLCSWIRIKMLRPKSPLYRAFVQEGFTDCYQMALLVLHCFYGYLQEETLPPPDPR